MRRSSRTVQPPQASHSSASSSSSSSRPERSTRSHQKQQSIGKSRSPLSHSSEEGDDSSEMANGQHPHTRRRRRDDPEDEDNGIVKSIDDDEAEIVEEEEVTRCICGQQDYPGPPVLPSENPSPRESKPSIRENANPDATVTDIPLDEAGGLFIQCDDCKVWQHGGCVGIMDEAMSPEEYYCELCRRDLHKIVTGVTGQKYSRYLPVLGPSPKTSRAPSYSKDLDTKSRDAKTSRPTPSSIATKRRSTMNSRDAAYDEEEQLRRAIEASKGENTTASENGSKRPKRVRSDSEESKQDAKRQRTSESPSPPGPPESQVPDSGEEDSPTANGGRKAQSRSAVRSQREKEQREREKEKERAEAAGKRKGRAERRRGEDLEAVESKGNQDTASQFADPPTPTHNRVTEIPPPTSHPTITQPRKTGRPAARRGRVGRNQYTKDRDTFTDPDGSPNRSQSRTGSAVGEDGSHSNGAQTNGEISKPSRPKFLHPQRTTMNEMRRRVTAILEFISRTQIEMAGERTPPSAAELSKAEAGLLRSVAEGIGPSITVNGESEKEKKDREFSDLNSIEMLDDLTRKLMLWQKEFGKYGEK